MKILRLFFVLLLVGVLLTACTPSGDPAPWLVEFFDGYSGADLYALIIAGVIGFTQGFFPGFSLFEWLKQVLGLADKWAHYMIVGVTMILATFVLWVTGELVISDLSFNLKMIISTVYMIYQFSQVGYKNRTYRARNGA